jgi:hypothetical protein
MLAGFLIFYHSEQVPFCTFGVIADITYDLVYEMCSQQSAWFYLVDATRIDLASIALLAVIPYLYFKVITVNIECPSMSS